MSHAMGSISATVAQTSFGFLQQAPQPTLHVIPVLEVSALADS
jgi:hypothetical protein